MCKKNPVTLVAWILVMIGALNWGLVGISYFLKTNLNVVNLLLGSIGNGSVEAVIYLLVGLSAVYKLAMCKKCCGGECHSCGDSHSSSPPHASGGMGGAGSM